MRNRKDRNSKTTSWWHHANWPSALLTRRLVVTVAAFLMVTIWISAGTINTWAKPPAQDDANSEAIHIYLPLVVGGNDASAGSEQDTPAFNDKTYVIDETVTDVNANAPALDEGAVSASIYCSTYINFSNQSNQLVYIYWINWYGQEVYYNYLYSGYYYWQQTYYGDTWVVRDSAGRQIKRITVDSCYYIYVTIYNSDFPQPTATPRPTNTATPRPTNTATPRPTNTATPRPTNTPTATAVPPTATATTAPVVTCPGNLVTNGDFEASFSNWSVGGYTNAQLTLSTDANSGAQAALLRGAGGVFISQPIAALAGADYALSGFGKTNNGTIFSAFGLNFYDLNGTRVGRTFAQVTTANYTAANAAITAPQGTAFAEIYLYTDGNIDFFADDLCVTRSGGPTPTLTPGANNATIGDRVWADLNRNGMQDEGGPGLEGIVVDLFEGCTDTIIAATRTTSNSGQYVFNNLAPGQYRIRATAPSGFVFTQKGAGNNLGDSDFNGNGITDCLTLTSGEQNFDIDAGLYDPTAAIPTPTPTATPIGGYIGDRVWEDLNRNGAQDTGEPSLQGVTVELLATCAGTTVLQTQQTTNSGQYLFRDLAPGQYLVRVSAPAGLIFSPQNANIIVDDSGDSDVDSNGITPCISLDPYEEDASVDAGLYNPQGTIPTPTPTPTPAGGLIGDRVWNDFDANGAQNAGEPGVAGVTVELLDACVGTTVLSTDVTDNRGEYSFSPLAAGSYRIRVTAPTGFSFSPQDAIGDDFADSDVDSSGVSSCVTLLAFTDITTVDAGINNPLAPTPTATNTPAPPTPTNTVVPPTPTFTPTPANTPTPTSTPGAPNPLVGCPDGATPLLSNGSFEEPVIPSTGQLVDESQVPGWLTNAGDNKIELLQSNVYGFASFDGVQFNELNASSAATLYQDIATTPGSMILWGFAHRGRNGTDTVSLRLGSPSAVSEQARFNTTNSTWLKYTGTYQVPVGQTTTRVEFLPLATAGGNNAEGNFLDGIIVCQLGN